MHYFHRHTHLSINQSRHSELLLCLPNAYRLTKLDYKRLKLNDHIHKYKPVALAPDIFSGQF